MPIIGGVVGLWCEESVTIVGGECDYGRRGIKTALCRPVQGQTAGGGTSEDM